MQNISHGTERVERIRDVYWGDRIIGNFHEGGKLGEERGDKKRKRRG